MGGRRRGGGGLEGGLVLTGALGSGQGAGPPVGRQSLSRSHWPGCSAPERQLAGRVGPIFSDSTLATCKKTP